MPIRKSTSSLSQIGEQEDYNPSFRRSNLNLRDKVRVEDNSSKKKILMILSIIFVILAALISFLFFYTDKGNLLDPVFTGIIDNIKDSGNTSGSNMFVNPLNGKMFSQEEANVFKDRKPIAVMVNNYEIARPSAGLSKADIIYEAVAEAGITRLMPIFYSQIPEKASSIRSARYYFAQLAAPYNPHYIHWGAAHVPACQKADPKSSSYCPPVGGKVETDPSVDAYDQIVKLGLPNLDGGNYSCDAASCAFGRDPQKLGKVPLEHTAFVRLPLVYTLAKDIRPQDTWHKFIMPDHIWKFKDEVALSDRGSIGLTNPITYKYWDTQPAFDVKWIYDKDKNEYIRWQGGVKQTDAIDGSEIRAKVVIIRFTVQRKVNDKKAHLFHDIVGANKALIFQDGKVIEGTWSRMNIENIDVYKDSLGNEVEFNRGQIWVQLVPTENKVLYESGIGASTPTPIPTQNGSN
jgi:hypothetical protein